MSWLKRIPPSVTLTLKVAFALGLLTLMWRGGKLQPQVIVAAAGHWPMLLGVAAMIFTIVMICGFRWALLLRGHEIVLSARQTVALTMIGTLFSAVIPGAVSGDLVKGYYVAREVESKRTLALASILMDRILGLSSLATVASIGVVWNHHLVLANHTLAVLSLMALGGCGVGFIGLLAAVFASHWVLNLAHRLPALLPARPVLIRMAEVLASYRGQVHILLGAFAMSFPVHLLGCASMLVCLHAVGESSAMPPSLVLFAFPLGMLAVAVPITPIGIGVGQAAFYAVCNMAVPGSGSAGANAFTVYQAIQLPVFLLGLIPYIAYRKSAPLPRDP
jgi:glycosyltransferase 2 family protein